MSTPYPARPENPRRQQQLESRTLQQLHPLGVLASRPLTVILALALPFYAGAMTWFGRHDIVAPVLALLAVLAIVGSSLSLLAWSGPQYAPFPRRGAIVAVSFALVALSLEVAGSWSQNQYIRDDWAGPAIGIVIIALAPYRPPVELTILGVAAACWAAALAVLQAPWFVTAVPLPVFVVVQCAPILAMALGAAAFSRSLISGLEKWRARAMTAVSTLDATRTDWIARSVQQSHITTLNQRVAPFFASVLESGEVTAATSEQARLIAGEFRRAMLAEVDRGWLDGVVVQAARSARATAQLAPNVVDDPWHLSESLGIDARTAIRALLVALFGHPDFVPNSLRIAVAPDRGRCRVLLSATVDCSENRLRSELAPYFAVMRILFPDQSIAFTAPALRLKFSYER